MRRNDQLVVTAARLGYRHSRMTVGRVNVGPGRILVVKAAPYSVSIARAGSKLVLGDLPDSWTLSMRSETRPPSGRQRLPSAVIIISVDVPSREEIEMVIGSGARAPNVHRDAKPVGGRIPVVLDADDVDELDLEHASPAERRVRQLMAELAIGRRSLFDEDPHAASRCEAKLITYLFGQQRGADA